MKRPTATAEQDLTSAQLTGRDASHVVGCADWPCLLHPRALRALADMRAAALTAGIDLFPVSGFRDFARQLAIWNGKYRGERPLLDAAGRPVDALQLSPSARVAAILQWSALPGASRHHWGTDVDLVDRRVVEAGYRPELVPAEYGPGGAFAALAQWLEEHAATWGFHRPYANDSGGVRPEPWHWSYAPVALGAAAALDVAVLRAALADSGIEGWEQIDADLPALHRRFVRNVDPPKG